MFSHPAYKKLLNDKNQNLFAEAAKEKLKAHNEKIRERSSSSLEKGDFFTNGGCFYVALQAFNTKLIEDKAIRNKKALIGQILNDGLAEEISCIEVY